MRLAYNVCVRCMQLYSYSRQSDLNLHNSLGALIWCLITAAVQSRASPSFSRWFIDSEEIEEKI